MFEIRDPGNFGRVNTDKLCVGQTCVTEEQFNSVFSNQSAAAGTPNMGDGAPDGPSALDEPNADAATTTTSSDSAPITSEAANDNQPIVDAENEQDVQEAIPEQEPEPAEPAAVLEPANDDGISENLPATSSE
jgi:hypothetical protein